MASDRGNKLFDQVQNLYTKEQPVTIDSKPESIYMINRFLSLSVRGFLAASECNAAIKLPDWAKYKFLYHAIQKGAPPKINYPKVEKEALTPRRKRALQRICEKFCVKEYHGMQILLLLEQQGFRIEAN